MLVNLFDSDWEAIMMVSELDSSLLHRAIDAWQHAIIALAIPLARGWAERRGRDLMPRASPAMSVGGPEPSMDVRIIPPLS